MKYNPSNDTFNDQKTHVMKQTLLILTWMCLSLVTFNVQGQVSINDDGTPPNASAGLDISADDKGLLIPRLTLLQRDAIIDPAHSLLIYQTDILAGYYYNAGTPETPNWLPLGSGAFDDSCNRIRIDSLPWTIDTPGSYYICQNLTGLTNTNGITIMASHVSLDLGGFSLIGGGGTSGEAITVPDSIGSLKVMNGHITGWGDEGIRAANAYASMFVDLHVSNNDGDGLRVGNNSVVKKCTASNNGSDGIDAEKYSVVTWCTARQNSGDGIDVGNGSVVKSSSSSLNASTGYRIGEGATVKDCASTENISDGYAIGAGSNVSNNTASRNDGHGFKWFGDCYIHHNTSDSNKQAGYYSSFANSRIEDNHATDNDTYGFDIEGVGGCLIIRNSASANFLANYDISSGHAVGPILGMLDVASSTNPLANLSY